MSEPIDRTTLDEQVARTHRDGAMGNPGDPSDGPEFERTSHRLDRPAAGEPPASTTPEDDPAFEHTRHRLDPPPPPPNDPAPTARRWPTPADTATPDEPDSGPRNAPADQPDRPGAAPTTKRWTPGGTGTTAGDHADRPGSAPAAQGWTPGGASSPPDDQPDRSDSARQRPAGGPADAQGDQNARPGGATSAARQWPAGGRAATQGDQAERPGGAPAAQRWSRGDGGSPLDDQPDRSHPARQRPAGEEADRPGLPAGDGPSSTRQSPPGRSEAARGDTDPSPPSAVRRWPSGERPGSSSMSARQWQTPPPREPVSRETVQSPRREPGPQEHDGSLPSTPGGDFEGPRGQDVTPPPERDVPEAGSVTEPPPPNLRARLAAAQPPEPTRVMAQPGDEPDVPRLLSGRYLLLERIANGGMASVWRGHDELLARTVAVKILHDHLAADEVFRERFRREAVSAAKLSHPYIVGIFDTGNDGRRVFLVMEYVDGVTLRDIIADTGGGLAVPDAAMIGEKVARALDYAHSRGLIHRDVKPANILLGRDGSVKIGDFGIAKADQADDLTKTGMVLGTAAYVAPEQILARPLDGKADQYALGCVLYEALTGHQPFKGETAVATAAQRLERRTPTIRQSRSDIPAALERIIAKSMAREPEHRFHSIGDLADQLTSFAPGETDRSTAALLAPLVAAAMRRRTGPRDTGESTPVDAQAPDDFGYEPYERYDDQSTAPRQRRGTSTMSRQPSMTPTSDLLRWAPLLLGIALIAVGLYLAVQTGLFGGGAGEEPTPTPEASVAPASPPPPAAAPLTIAAEQLEAFDPVGDGSENTTQLERMVDGDPQSAWRSEGYASEDFGGLKDGVGFVIDLGQPTAITEVQLDSVFPGPDIELRTADSAPSSVDATALVAAVPGSGDSVVLRPEQPVTARYLVVFVTGSLSDSGDGGPNGHPFRASFSELRVLGQG